MIFFNLYLLKYDFAIKCKWVQPIKSQIQQKNNLIYFSQNVNRSCIIFAKKI